MLRKHVEWVLFGLFCILFASIPARAEWSVVFEDSLWISTGITSLNLDTTHFGEPILLVGTGRDSAGQSCLLRIRAQPFEVLDTVYQGHHSPVVCRAANLNADGELDYALGVARHQSDSIPFYALILTYGPTLVREDTLMLQSSLHDLAIDTVRKELWMARVDVYTQVDTSYIIQYLSYNSGYIGSWSFELTPRTDFGDSLGGLAIVIRDIDSDGQEEIVGVWGKSLKWWCSGCISHVPAESRHACGARILEPGQSAETQSWLLLQADGYREQLYSLSNPRSFPMADLNGDGMDEVVYAWKYAMDERPYFTKYRSEVQIRSLTDGQLIWTRAYPTNPYGPFTSIIYPIDGDELPDVLISERSDWSGGSGTLLGVRGSDGDSLFAISFRPVSSAVTPAFGGDGASPDVVEARGSWLYRWRLDVATAIADEPDTFVPESAVLHPNRPNPFNGATTIRYTLNAPAVTVLTIHNILGQRVATLVDGPQTAGGHSMVWEGMSDNGQPVASGVYFYRLRAGAEVLTRSMMLLK